MDEFVNKKKLKLFTLSDIQRKLGVPSYRLQYLFSKGILKREDFPRAGKSMLFTERDVREIKKLLASIKTFVWSGSKKVINQ